MRTQWLLARLQRLAQRRGGAPIGLELGARALHAAQIEGRGRDLRLRAAARIALPEPADDGAPELQTLTAALRRGFRSAPFQGNRVVAALPTGEVKLMLLNYESRDAGEGAAILKLVGERLKDAVSEYVVDYVPLRTTGDKQGEKSALVAAARCDRVEAYLEAIRKAGLRVDSVEIAPVALRRLVGWLTAESAEENVLVIDCGSQSSSLHVLWGRRLLLYRDVDFAESSAVDQVAKSLDLDSHAAAKVLASHGVASRTSVEGADIGSTLLEILKPQLYALSEHVNKAVIYTASKTHGASLHRVYLFGNPGSWPGATDFLSQLLSLPVLSVDPLSPFQQDQGGCGDPGNRDFAVATGLALKRFARDG